ncbi:oxidoreductase [Labrys miyagiensis]
MYMQKYLLTGRHALVTGGGRGIGLACVEALAEAGARVVIADFDMKVAQDAQAELRTKGYETTIVKMDVTKPDQVTALADDLAADGRGIEILVNNAGIARSMTPAETVADEHWLNVIDVNLNGVFWCCRAFGKHMLAAGKGSIVNIGSMSGFIVNKPQEQSYYNASKAAVHHLTKSLAAEWAPRGVRVNAVAPTYINTPLTAFASQNPDNRKMFKTWLDMTPMGRMGEVDEIASTVHFLASDAASLLTGSIVVADGGYTCW